MQPVGTNEMAAGWLNPLWAHPCWKLLSLRVVVMVFKAFEHFH